ncbi:flagellar basal-body MS-ring/collar protein FliF [Yunchengibacter salinarum]|uniref:flagellar basal-body MS-ring/collar protein FliF n=1 Tax=Yunchengibacter salinarum TaxID=3133399 RepID=UPI0035B6A9A5
MEALRQFVQNLGTTRLIIIGVVGAVTIGFFGLIIGQLQSSPMTVLYSDLQPAAASDIAQRLDAQNIPYETDAGGTIIKVPEGEVDRLRLSLAGEGLAGNVVGMELFDEDSSFGRTSFELNVNYVRAVEGELSRTISFIQSVQEARVHIVMPERRPFQRDADEPSAAIVIKPRGMGVTEAHAQSIQALVASAIPGLSPGRVTITDTSGRLLSKGSGGEGMGSFSSLEEARMAMEQRYRNKVESLLASRVGRGNVRAEVSVEMNMSRTTRSETRFDPAGQVVAAQTVIEEQSSEREESGSVTVGNNLPDADNNASSGPGSSEERVEERTDFQNSRTETVVVSEPGTVDRVRVAVLVDGIREKNDQGETTNYQDRTEDEIDALRELVLTAIPYNAERGDAVTVQAMRFADPPPMLDQQTQINIMGFEKQDIFQLLQVGGLILVATLVLLTVIRPLVSRILEAIPDAQMMKEAQQQEQARLAAEMEQDREQLALQAPDDGSITPEMLSAAARGDDRARALIRQAQQKGEFNLDDLNTESRIDVAQVEGRIQESAIKKVADIIQANPDDSVAIVRQWLYADS